MNIKEIETQELRELLRIYTPSGFVMGAVSQNSGKNKISLLSIEIEGFSGFTKKVTVDFSSLSGLVALQGKNGYGKSSLWKAIEQCLYCDSKTPFNKNKQTSQHQIMLKYRDGDGEHILVCTPVERTLDGKPAPSQLIESVRLNLEIAKLTSSAKSNDFKDYSAKVLNLTDLDNYFELVTLRQVELDFEIENIRKKIDEYKTVMAKYAVDCEAYQHRIAQAKDDAKTFEGRQKEWETAVQEINKAKEERKAEYLAALESYNSQLRNVKEKFAQYFAEQNAKIQSQKSKLAVLEGTEGGGEKELNAAAKEVKAEIAVALAEQQEIQRGLDEVRAAALDEHLAAIFSEKEREIMAADYVNGKKRLETKLKNARKLSVGECAACTRELTAEMISDLISRYETAVDEMVENSKLQSSLKGKETRAKDKYVWERDSELSVVKRRVSIYSDSGTLKDTEFRKKYPADTGIELVDKLLDLYARVSNIKSLRTKNAGEIKALTASIQQLEKDLISEEAYIKKNAVQSRPQEPVYMTAPECPKPIVLSEIVEPKKPVEPEGYGAISGKLSENEQCKEVLRKKTSVISSITKKYFDKLKPEIEAIAKKLHLDLTVEITKNMSIGYTYNGVKMDSFSGGEQTAVNIAVSLAYSYLESDVLFIDEKLDSLDKENFVTVQSILKTAISELGIRAFVIISHRELDNMNGRITLC